ncbi:MAG TPA: serine/threonine-protein kinase, partial [Ornithinibacter sp.]|nr:serine/threonine-protein kinase [Ornithinibacter sp.]
MDDEGTQLPEVPGFEVGELLARGGTSEVWAGVSVPEGRRVAIKVVQAGLGEVEAAAREAAVSAAAASAHIVEIHSVIDLADGRVALVMPHLRGGSLDALVRTRGHLTAGEVVTALAPVASALGRLHGLGVVHGDVSPGNVLLDLDGRPVLGDLGLGHVVGDISPGVWGTDGYVAPEVVMGGDPSPASDVYGVGALGWLCLTGSVPGAPGLRPALADVSRAGPSAAGLVEALEAALSPDPADRPDAHELGWLLFQAATATPLDLVRGGDEVSAVTYRLRAAAGEAPVLEATPRWRGGWARLAGRGAAPPTSIPVERRRGAGRHSEPATRAG